MLVGGKKNKYKLPGSFIAKARENYFKNYYPMVDKMTTTSLISEELNGLSTTKHWRPLGTGNYKANPLNYHLMVARRMALALLKEIEYHKNSQVERNA
ncbi:hypothetical protein EVAR_33968_1 [Eumeta japonica]|uniref:Uncharacterized protein n=1 Tax=Eumeta variegata TaxID=151549 RepID=A0A4C1X1S2_EUMVA|nr:hypothetical protein EVAR_33968_1 [Eumeta japonica]